MSGKDKLIAIGGLLMIILMCLAGLQTCKEELTDEQNTPTVQAYK